MDPSHAAAGAGLILGIGVGAAARVARFCTLGAIADALTLRDFRRLSAWGLAVAVAMIGTQLLHGQGIVDLGDTIYLTGGIGWLGAILGGLLFGFGMALVGTCAFGSLIRIGDGDLRAIVTFLVIGVFAFATISGALAHLRADYVQATDLRFEDVSRADLPALATLVLPLAEPVLRLVIVMALAGALIFTAVRAGVARRPGECMAAIGIGLAVVGGWLATGVLGRDEFDPVPLASLTFVRPIGEGLFYVMFMSGTSLTFAVAIVTGAIVGAAGVSRARGEQRLEGFDGVRELRRHLIGGALMGTGGVMALGCTIGQGVTGLATLAPASFIAAAAIFQGAALGLRYLEAGTLAGMVRGLLDGIPRTGRSTARPVAPERLSRRS